MRSLLVAVAAVLLVPAGLWAEEIRGTGKSVAASKNRLTILVGEKERTIVCDPKCKVTMKQEARRIFPRRTSVQEYISSLSNVPSGATVTVMLETTNGMEMATSLQTNQLSSTSSGGRFLSGTRTEGRFFSGTGTGGGLLSRLRR